MLLNGSNGKFYVTYILPQYFLELFKKTVLRKAAIPGHTPAPVPGLFLATALLMFWAE